jgi:membrane-associated phospholipid phosphatase
MRRKHGASAASKSGEEGIFQSLARASVSLRGWWERRPLLAAFVFVGAACVISVLLFDRPLANHYRHVAAPEIVTTFKSIGRLGDATPYVVVLLTLIVAFRVASYFQITPLTQVRLTRYTDACVLVLLSLAISAAVLHTLKIAIGRYRPRALFEQGLFELAPINVGYLTSSFPSGHSQTVWAIAAALIIVYPRYDLLYLGVAALVSYSRVVTYDHYLSDVLFGSYLGAATAVLVKRYLYDRRGIPLTIAFDPAAWAADARAAAEESAAEPSRPAPSANVLPYASARPDKAKGRSSEDG